MKNKSLRSFRIWSVLIFPAGILLIACDGMLMITRFQNPEISRFFTLVATLILLVAGVLAVISGIRSLAFINNRSRGVRCRGIRSKIAFFKRMALFTIILTLVSVIISCILGITLWMLGVMILCGIIVPLFYIAAAASIRV